MDRTAVDHQRTAAIRSFVRKTFGLRGTLRLHRVAFGADLLRAPANVLLAPVFLITRLLALLAYLVRLRRLAGWLARRQILLETQVARQVALKIHTFLKDLTARGLGVAAPDAVISHEVREYTGVRSAIGEITTTLFVLVAGYIVFQSATPGVISLATPVAEMRAHAEAVAQFPLGDRMGRMYYVVFSTDLGFWYVLGTGVVLAMLASVVTTFAGVIVDPLQVLTGTHKRRLSRLLSRLDRADAPGAGLAREHVAARFADISDIALNVWRSLRG